MAPGGAGGSGEYWVDENIARENNYETNDQQHKSGIRSGHPRGVIIGDKHYESVMDASRAYNSDRHRIRRWCIKGINNLGELCRYEDEEQTIFTGRRFCKCSSKPIVFRGKTYEAVKDLAEELGLRDATITQWLRRGFNPKGEPCRYLNDPRELVFEDRYELRKIHRLKPVIINGVMYQTVKEASNELGISRPRINSYLRGVTFSPDYICEYA